VIGPIKPTFLYDGDCAFCSACARFIERHIPNAAHVVPYQFADLAALGVTQAECEAAVQWIGPDGETAAGPDAIAKLLGTSAPLWRAAGGLLGSGAARWAAWPAYRWVARNRHRMPDGSAACAVSADRYPPRATGSDASGTSGPGGTGSGIR
jgi:predicted DCC family thiol-disulfide oxidoreductase YuxK